MATGTLIHGFQNSGQSLSDITLTGPTPISFSGSGLRKLQLRPNLIQKASKFLGKPTEVYRGVNVGYSMPIYNSDDEELFFRCRIPFRWDGTTDPQFGMCVSLSAGETVGDYFKFQLGWQVSAKGNVISETVSTSVSEQIVITGRNDAYDTYFIFFNFDANDVSNPLEAGNMLQARIRRIDATDPDVSNEIIIWDWAAIWAVDKAYSAWAVSVNDT